MRGLEQEEIMACRRNEGNQGTAINHVKKIKESGRVVSTRVMHYLVRANKKSYTIRIPAYPTTWS